jgi:hypothetical protein
MDVTPGQLHLRWTEGLSQAAIEHGFPPVPPAPEDPPAVVGQDLAQHADPKEQARLRLAVLRERVAERTAAAHAEVAEAERALADLHREQESA